MEGDVELKRLHKLLGIAWNDESLLEEALRDESYVNEHPDQGLKNNRKLAFLGDAVLELAVRYRLLCEHEDASP